MTEDRNSRTHIEVTDGQVDLVHNEPGGTRGPELTRKLRATPLENGNVEVALVGQRGGSYGAKIEVKKSDLSKWAQIAGMDSPEEE